MSSSLPGSLIHTPVQAWLPVSGGKKYFCGGGAMGYQQDDAFEKAGIVLLYQNFVCPTYSQFERQNFISGLSIIDALMNLGLNGVRDLLIKNV